MRRIAMEMTAAGMDDENVKPTFKPRYTLEAVKITVIRREDHTAGRQFRHTWVVHSQV